MLNETEKLVLASLVPSPTFQLLKKYKDDRIATINTENPERETEFQTLLKVGENKGRVAELLELIKTLENYYRKSIEK